MCSVRVVMDYCSKNLRIEDPSLGFRVLDLGLCGLRFWGLRFSTC